MTGETFFRSAPRLSWPESATCEIHSSSRFFLSIFRFGEWRNVGIDEFLLRLPTHQPVARVKEP